MKTKKKFLVVICAVLVACLLSAVAVVATADHDTDTITIVSPIGGDTGYVDGVSVVWPTHIIHEGYDTDQDLGVDSTGDRVDFLTLRNGSTTEIGQYNTNIFFNQENVPAETGINSSAISLSRDFVFNTTYSKDGTTNSIYIEYPYLDYLMYIHGSSRSDGEMVINVTPVVRKLNSVSVYNRDYYYDLTNYSYSKVLSHNYALPVTIDALDYSNVETLDIKYNANTDTYFTEYTYEDGDLEAGCYNISFILTYLSDTGEHRAIVVDNLYNYSISHDLHMAAHTELNENDFALSVTYYSDKMSDVSYSGDVTSNENELAHSFVTNYHGTVPFTVEGSDDITLSMGDYQYGSFDDAVFKYAILGGEEKQVFDTTYKKDGAISLDVIKFRLYRVVDGERFIVYNTEYMYGNSGSTDANEYNSFFNDCSIFNDIIAGDYEIEVYFIGGDGYDACMLSDTFSVLPKEVTTDSRDIYASSATYDGNGRITEETLAQNSAVLADYLAYYDAYNKIESAGEREALYQELYAEYSKVVEAYNKAYSNYNAFLSACTINVDNNGNEISRQIWSNILTYCYYNMQMTERYGYSDYSQYNATRMQNAYNQLLVYPSATATAESDAEKDILSPSYFGTAYSSYCEYVEAYNDYVAFCASKGIFISNIEDRTADYTQMYEVAESYLENKGSGWRCNIALTDLDYIITAIEPDRLGGLPSYTTLEKSYNGAGQYPNLILWHYVDGATAKLTNLNNMFSYETLQGDTFGTGSYERYITLLTNTDLIYSANDPQYAFVAYRLLDENGELLCTSAIHAGDHDFSISFEGNYTGSISGLTFTITPVELSVINYEEIYATKVYDGKAYDGFTNQIGTLGSNPIEQYFLTYYFGSERTFQVLNPKSMSGDDAKLISTIYYTYNITTLGYSPLTYVGLDSSLFDSNAKLVYTIELQVNTSDDPEHPNWIWVEVDEAKEVGEYRITYTLDPICANDYVLNRVDSRYEWDDETQDFEVVNSYVPVTSLTTYLSVIKQYIAPEITVSNVTHGDTIADIVKKINATIVSYTDDYTKNLVVYDYENAFLTADKEVLAKDWIFSDGEWVRGGDEVLTTVTEVLPADTKVVLGKTYTICVPVSLVDEEHTAFNSEVTYDADNDIYYVECEITIVNKKVVSVDWSDSTAFEADYNGKTHIADLKAFYVDVDGNKVDLIINAEDNLTNAGTHRIMAVISDGEDFYTLDNNTTLTAYTINPIKVTPSIKKVIYSDGESIIYGNNAEIWLSFEFAVDGLIAEDDINFFDFITEQFIANTTDKGYMYYVAEDYDAIRVGTHVVSFDVTCETCNYYMDKEDTTIFAEYIVTPYDASNSTLDYDPEIVYSGEAQILDMLVTTDRDEALKEGRDYEVSYVNNVNAGTATLTITFKGDYTGSMTQDFTISKYGFAMDDELVVYASKTFVYTGSPITPVTGVEVDGFTLTADDIVVEYRDNINVGMASYTIKPNENSNFAFKDAEFTFEIVPYDATGSKGVTVDSATYNRGNKLTPDAVIKIGDRTLEAGVDYELTYTNNTDVGSGQVEVTFKGNYTGLTTQTFTIEAKEFDGEVFVEDTTFTGSELKPAVEVIDGKLPLVEGTDYELVYSNNINAGEATVTVNFKGNYKGTTSKTFTIAPLLVFDATVTAEKATFTGSAVTPTVVVKADGTTFVLGTDFDATYDNNINVGKGTISITFKGNYMGSTSGEFDIEAKEITGTITTPDVTYNGSVQTPTPVVKDGDTLLVEGTDYTVTSYENNTNAGTATVTVTFQGNYKGTGTGTFTVKKLAYTSDELSVYEFKDDSVVYDGESHMIYVTGSIEGVTVSYDKVGYIAAGKYTVTANFTVDANHEAIAPMTATLEIRAKVIEKVVEDTDEPEGQGSETEEKLPDIIVEYENGFASSITVKVSVVAAEEITDKASTLQLMIDYKDQLNRHEAISRLYEVKLIEISEDGTEKEIKVEDLGNGATIKVKMMVPEDLVDTDKLTRILHVHDANDITELTPVETEAELAVGKYFIDEDGYLVTIIDRLSEFAFIYEKDCIAHWFLIGEMALFIAFVCVCWFVLKKRKFELIPLIGCSVYFVAFVVTAIFGHCTACVVLTIVSALLLVAVIALFLHIWEFIGKIMKKVNGDDTPADEKKVPVGEFFKAVWEAICTFFKNLFHKDEKPMVVKSAPKKTAPEVVKPKKTVEEKEALKEAEEEKELEEQFEKLVSIQPAPESYEGDGKVETVGVCLAGRKKVYRFAPAGVTYQVGDKVIADTVNGMTRGIIVHANYYVNPEELVADLKNVTPKKSNNNQ